MLLASLYLIYGHKVVIYNIFSVTRYAQDIPVYSILQKPISVIILENILMKFRMTGNTFIRIHNISNLLIAFEISYIHHQVTILANGTNDFRIKLQKSLLIHHKGPQLNKTSESAPLMLLP